MDQIGSLLERPRLYHNIDGLGEVSGGVFCLGFALILWLISYWPEDSVWHKTSLAVFVALLLVIQYGVKAIKRRITYPRTGFVEYRRRERWSAMTIAAVLSGALVPAGLVMVSRRHWDIATPASFVWLVFVAVYAYTFARTVHWKWVIVAAMALTAVVIAFQPADVLGRVANDSWVAQPVRTRLVGRSLLFLMTYGAILLISGAISFWLYLRHTHMPEQESQ